VVRAWLERLTANAPVATVLGSIPFPASVGTDEAVLNIVRKKKKIKKKTVHGGGRIFRAGLKLAPFTLLIVEFRYFVLFAILAIFRFRRKNKANLKKNY
jgi:hypothetical protein